MVGALFTDRIEHDSHRSDGLLGIFCSKQVMPGNLHRKGIVHDVLWSAWEKAMMGRF